MSEMMQNRTVAEICRDFELQEEAKPHLAGQPTPQEFVSRLFKAKLYGDATRFLAYALPEREAVWWVCLSVRSIPRCYGDETSARALDAAEAWVKSPTDANRESALAAARKHKFEMPTASAAWAAMAAGWSGLSAPPPGQTAPLPGKNLTAHAVSGAIQLATNADPDRAADLCRKFLETGLQIAQGKMRISP